MQSIKIMFTESVLHIGKYSWYEVQNVRYKHIFSNNGVKETKTKKNRKNWWGVY